MPAARLIAWVCFAEVLGMLSFSTFPALIPEFEAEWGLSRTEAGIVSGAFFAGYVVLVPVLTALTDRVDPKRVLLFALVLGGASSLAYAFLAEGLWTASVFRLLQGAGLAGTYMPGLKALSDHVEGPAQSRAVAFYTASFGIGAGLSFVFAGEIAAVIGWRWAFGANAIGTAVAFAILALTLPPSPQAGDAPEVRFLDFRPVLRNRRAMPFTVGYLGHSWELFALRSWMVPFLVFTLGLHDGTPWLFKATTIAALATLLGVPSSILGNEMAIRFGRQQWIAMVTGATVALALVIGFASSLSYGLVVGLCLLYGLLAGADSAALTSGTVAAALPGQRGATLAVHSFFGFMGGVMAPPAIGLILDLAGRDSVVGWGLAFLGVGFGSALAFVSVFRRRFS